MESQTTIINQHQPLTFQRQELDSTVAALASQAPSLTGAPAALSSELRGMYQGLLEAHEKLQQKDTTLSLGGAPVLLMCIPRGPAIGFMTMVIAAHPK